MGADATLVNMAYRAAMAKAPGDWSKSFDIQFEGIIAANKALADAGKSFVGAFAKVQTGYLERVKKGEKKAQSVLEAQELWKHANGAGTTLIKDAAAKNKYQNGEGLGKAFKDAAFSVPTDIYNNIVKTNKKVFQTKKDKQYISEQYDRLQRWKNDRISDKANIRQLVDGINSGLINLEKMHPEYKALLAQLIESKGDASSKGIRIYNRKSDDKLMVQFTPNRMESEYEYNIRIQNEDLDPITYPSKRLETLPYSDETAQQAGMQTISFQDLMDNVKYRELELQNGVHETVTSFDAIASARNPRSKTFVTNGWDDGTVNSGKAQATKMVRDLFYDKGQQHISDLATTDFFGKGSTYRDDLSGLVGQMDLSGLGIVDEGQPGYQDDLHGSEAKDLLKEEIIARLINPQTPDDLKFAKMQIEDYYVGMAKDVFDTTRNTILAAEEIEEAKTGRTGKAETKSIVLDMHRSFTSQDTKLDKAMRGETLIGWKGNKFTTKDGGKTYTDPSGATESVYDLLTGPYFGMEERIAMRKLNFGQTKTKGTKRTAPNLEQQEFNRKMKLFGEHMKEREQ